MKIQIRHGMQDAVIAANAQDAAAVVARMLETGLTNILISRADTDVQVTQSATPMAIRFDVPIDTSGLIVTT